MSLLRGIQSDVLDGNTDISSLLYKLRFLASRLGSDPLEERVRHELDGYPGEAVVPDYRVVGVSFTGSFSGAFGSGIRNAPIPPFLIEEYAGKGWNNFQMRQSIASIENLVSSQADDGFIRLNVSNLMLLLDGKIYPDMACNEIKGITSIASLVEIQNAVRGRILELTIQLEKKVPAAVEVTLEKTGSVDQNKEGKIVTQVTNNIVYGDMTAINNDGSINTINTNVRQGNFDNLMNTLTSSGMPEQDAEELALIVQNEKPDSNDDSLGPKARKWLAEKISQGIGDIWKMTTGVAASVVGKAVAKYYGLD